MPQIKHFTEGFQLLQRAHGIRQDCIAAFDREDWNLVLRRAQESAELYSKAAVKLLGQQFKFGHKTEALEQLRELVRSTPSQLTSLNGQTYDQLVFRTGISGEVPICVLMRYKDIEAGHGISLYGETLLAVQWFQDGSGIHYKDEQEYALPRGREIQIKSESERGGYISFSDGSRLVALLNEHFAQFLYDAVVNLPRDLSSNEWDHALMVCSQLAKDRDPSFYQEREYGRPVAARAIGEIEQVRSLLAKIFWSA